MPFEKAARRISQRIQYEAGERQCKSAMRPLSNRALTPRRQDEDGNIYARGASCVYDAQVPARCSPPLGIAAAVRY